MILAVWLAIGDWEQAGLPDLLTRDAARLAVLYFDDHSEGGDLGYLASGITEGLIHELSRLDAVEVISRNGVKLYRDSEATLDSIAGALRVGSL
jgi:TolB-like protein